MTAQSDPAPLGSGPAGPTPKPRGRTTAVWLLAVVAVIAQAFAALYYVVMGLGWGGPFYLAAIGQGAIILLVMGLLLVLRKPLITLPLPIVSALLTVACLTVDEGLDARACSAEALAAVNSLPLPPDLTEDLEFEQEFGRGCAVHFNSRLSEAEFVQHYVDHGRQAGWAVVATVPAQRTVVQNADWVVTAEVNTRDTGRYILGVEPRS